MIRNTLIAAFVITTLLGGGFALAQSFGDSEIESVPVSDVKGVKGIEELPSMEDLNVNKNKEESVEKDTEEEEIFIPEQAFQKPTQDGSKRGGAVFSRINDKGQAVVTNNKIFLFYKDFKIHGKGSGMTSCDIAIYVVTNLDRKLVNLDVKLVWPDLTTFVSFANVQPNTQTYYNYTLLGDGCYSLDKMPNIVVNRCRVKGMTASQCASNIVWLQSK